MKDVKKDISWRIYLVYFVVCLFGLAIFSKAVYIQLVEGESLEKEVQSLTLVERNIEAVRGNIYAEDGGLMATSIPIYELRFDPNSDAISDDFFYKNVDSLAWSLSHLFKDRSMASYRKELINARREGDRYHLIKRNVRYPDLKMVKRFPLFREGKYRGGLIIHQKNKRERPFKMLAARTIGYDRQNVSVGLEGAYDDILSGVDGQRLMQKIAGGVWMPVGDDNEIMPEDGMDIYSTIDVNIQDVAESALRKQLEMQKADHGCVVLMEVKTGAIRAIANLKRAEDGHYYEGYNYAIGESTEPGSTFKLAVLIAAIDDGYVDLDDIIDCGDGSKRYYEQMMYDSNHDRGGWGKISVKRVLEVSSNIGMAEIVTKAYGQNPQKFIDHLKKMDLGKPLGLKIKGEGRPYIKDTDSKSWSGLTLPWMAHGYEVRETPLQTLTLYNAIANDGVMVKPKFVGKITKGRKKVRDVETEVINPHICSIETVNKLKSALEGVVENGTARNLRNADYKIAGKTGTAQIANKNYGYKYNSQTSYQASFVGYFPADDPQYSCIVVINAPTQNVYYGNVVAGPIFKEVADKVFANRLDMHKELTKQPFYATSAIPYSKSGRKSAVEKVFSMLDIPVVSEAKDNIWVETHTKDSLVELTPRKIIDNLVPNVLGMGLRDAVYILENKGLRVEIKGRGTVKEQSLQAGARIVDGQIIMINLS